jgi:trimeric autotransporter adhesin
MLIKKPGLIMALTLLSFTVLTTKVSAQYIFTKAGTGNPGDYSLASATSLGTPTSVTVDATGNLYVGITSCRVRKVNASDGKMVTVAGKGSYGFSGDGGPAISASLSTVKAAAFDAGGNLYIADQGNHRIRKVAASDGKISTVAGNGTGTFAGDGGAATAASLNQPAGVVVDGAGNIYIADLGNQRIRKVAAVDGKISTVAGTGVAGFTDAAALSAQFNNPSGLALDGSGNLLIADYTNHRIRKLTFSTGMVTTVAGNGIGSFSGDGGLATAASISGPTAVTVDASGNFYIAAQLNSRIRKVTAADGKIATVAGDGSYSYAGDGGAATAASLNQPMGVAADGSGNLFIADYNNRRIRKVTAADAKINSVAGNGFDNFSGDGGASTSAAMSGPTGIAFDGSGNLYIADQENNRIRKVDALTGIISTIAGTGAYGATGDGGLAVSATLSSPTGIAVDGSGNLYIADQGNHKVRKVSTSDGRISTVAGNGTSAFTGDGGLATAASLYSPMDVAVDASGNLYISDRGNHRLRKVTAADGKITTLAGTGTAAYGGDGGLAIGASLNEPNGIAVDANGNVYVADRSNNRIRKINAADGIITTIAGTGTLGFGGDDVATATPLYFPYSVELDAAGNLYTSDMSNRVRKLNISDGMMSTVAGSGFGGYGGDGGLASAAYLYSPFAIAFAPDGNMYIADYNNYRVRYVCSTPSIASVNSTAVRTVFPGQANTVHFINNCSLQAKIAPTGTNPVAGNITENVWIESGVPTTSNGKPYVQRHYGITPEYYATTTTGAVTLYFMQAEFTAYNAHPSHGADLPINAADAANNKANLFVTKRNGTTSDGTGLYHTYSGAGEVLVPASVTWDATLNAWAVSVNTTGFGGFFVSSSQFVLPLKLVDFSANLQSKDAVVAWSTAFEEKTASFVVERSFDGRAFARAYTVKAIGQGENQYFITDKNMASSGFPMVYYRLKMIDQDGSFTYSKIVTIRLKNNEEMVMLFPNPTHAEATLIITVPAKEAVRYSIIDQSGRVVGSRSINLEGGSNRIPIPVQDLASGIYTIQINGTTTSKQLQFIKQ